MLRLGIARSLRAFLRARLGVHAASGSPLVTTIINVLNADRWRAAGHWPSLVLGHSIGEVSAAYVAGLLSIDEAICTAHVLGTIGAEREGAMVHARVTRAEATAWAHTELRVAA